MSDTRRQRSTISVPAAPASKLTEHAAVEANDYGPADKRVVYAAKRGSRGSGRITPCVEAPGGQTETRACRRVTVDGPDDWRSCGRAQARARTPVPNHEPDGRLITGRLALSAERPTLATPWGCEALLANDLGMTRSGVISDVMCARRSESDETTSFRGLHRVESRR